jgi:hypothetical protein
MFDFDLNGSTLYNLKVRVGRYYAETKQAMSTVVSDGSFPWRPHLILQRIPLSQSVPGLSVYRHPRKLTQQLTFSTLPRDPFSIFFCGRPKNGI